MGLFLRENDALPREKTAKKDFATFVDKDICLLMVCKFFSTEDEIFSEGAECTSQQNIVSLLKLQGEKI